MSTPHARFVDLDESRARREWARYEGTAQRTVFRQLRERFLARHAADGRWSLDAGSGPGRFLQWMGGPTTVRVALDLSREMLAVGRELMGSSVRGPRVERLRGDALRPPFAPATFCEVALVGNALGFEGRSGDDLLARVEELVLPGGTLVAEVAPGPGERSRYLGRLPPGAVRRLLASPLDALLPRVEKEGFERVAERHRSHGFRRWKAEELARRWEQGGWSVREVMAVAPALGPDRGRLSEVAREPSAWHRMLELEERLGLDPARWPRAAAVLLAATR